MQIVLMRLKSIQQGCGWIVLLRIIMGRQKMSSSIPSYIEDYGTNPLNIDQLDDSGVVGIDNAILLL